VPTASALTRCTGSIVVDAKVRVKKAGKTTTKTVKLGSATFTIAAGKVATLNVNVPAKSLALLRQRGKLSATATARAKDARGGVAKTTTAKIAYKAK
jgi:hypothetical protein